MDLLLLELILWAGLLFLFWGLKDGLGQVESEIETATLTAPESNPGGRNFLPDRVFDRIGTYRDASIYRYAVFQGRCYEFDRACPDSGKLQLRNHELYLEPGLIYVRIPDGQDTLSGSDYPA